MSKQITDSTGASIEVFTVQELETQKTAALEKFKADNPVNKEELDSLQEELKQTKDALAKLEEKDLNFGNLRTQKEAAEKKVTDLTKEIDTKIGNVKKEILSDVMKDHFNETMKGLSAGDQELEKKIKFEYDRLSDVPVTKEEISKKLRDAWYQATKPEGINPLNVSVISSGGVSRIIPRESKTFSSEEKEFAKKLAASGGIKLDEKDFN